LGVIRCLKDNGYLSKVKYVCAVSGGSVLAGHLVSHWDQYNGSDDRFNEAVEELLKLVRLDMRGRIGRRMPFVFPFVSSTRLLEYYLKKKLGRKQLLKGLTRDGRPDLNILATNATRGGMTAFSQTTIMLDDEARLDTGVSVAGIMKSPRLVSHTQNMNNLLLCNLVKTVKEQDAHCALG